MIRAASQGTGPPANGHAEPLRVDPPRTGLRPGTAAGNPQTPF